MELSVKSLLSNTPHHVVIPQDANELDSTFESAKNYLKSVTIESTAITELPKKCFRNCNKLNNVIFSKTMNLRKISMMCFMNCVSLKKIELPDSVEEIGEAAFQNCISLKSIIFSKKTKIEKINSFAFANTSLTCFFIPQTMKNIMPHAFMDCNALVEFNGESKTYFTNNGVLYKKKETKLCMYPQGNKNSTYKVLDDCESIEKFALENAKVENIIINSRVNKIGRYAFNNSKIVSLVLPNVTDVKEYAFGNMKNLTSFKIFGSIEALPNNAFNGTENIASMHLTQSMKEFPAFDASNLKWIIIPESLYDAAINAGVKPKIIHCYDYVRVSIH